MTETADSPLHLRNVTDFTLEHVPTFDYLNAPDQQMKVRYLSTLADGLKKTPLHPTNEKGAYLQLYKPGEGRDKAQPVAVKVFSTDGTLFRRIDKRMKERNKDDDLKKLLQDDGYILFANHTATPRFDELTPLEKRFLYLAHEHRLHEQLYAPYVLPGLFVAYPAPEDIIDFSYTYDPNDPVDQGQREDMEQLGNRFIGNNELIVAKGEPVFAMIQNFEKLGPSVFQMNPQDFTPEQITQLRNFSEKVKKVYQEQGYFPDQSMYQEGSGNLCFNDQNQLVLIDTNHLSRVEDKNDGTPRLFLKAIKKIVESK